MDFSGLKDYKTTVPGVVIIVGVTVALIKGVCTFEQWWTVVLAVMAAAGGGGLLLAGGKKPTCPPYPGADTSDPKAG